MNIAIVGPSPVPFGIGGMEYLQQGLYKSINENSEHRCELIKLPSREGCFWDLIDTYRSFYHLDLSHFDMVISIKYPAWMVQHNNHVCYMAHRLRGFYDTYHFLNMPEDFSSNEKFVKELIDYINTNKNPENLNEFFEYLDQLRIHQNTLPNEYFSFPNPFIRKITRYMDDFALSQTRIKKYSAISKTVKSRRDYFPIDANVDVIYPPSFLTEFKTGSYDYLFTVSRLDSPKRINLIIEAMKYVKGEIKLKIAGTGPEENKLKELAKTDSRIEFLGFKNNNEIIELYSNALAVLFLPYDEDYGLVTIEAMRSKKPVITCSDSGGTNEFVKHKVSGLIAEPNAQSLAKQIEYICKNKEEAIKMGERGFELVKDITWDKTVYAILEGTAPLEGKNIGDNTTKRKKITVTSNFAVYPPKGGGQVRIFNLYKNLAKHYDIEIVSMTNIDEVKCRKEISEDLFESVIPKTKEQAEEEWKYEKEIGIPVSDTALPLVSHLTPDYSKELKKSIDESDMVIVSHPYLLHEVEKFRGNKPLIYEAQDIEYNLKKNVYKKDNKETKVLLKLVHETERKACETSNLIMTCSEEDKITLSRLYNVPLEKIIVVPNGVDCTEVNFASMDDRKKNKKELGFEEEFIAIFIGSWHPPNIEAARYIIEFASKLPEVKFIIIGSVCGALKNEIIPKNVGLMGQIEEKEKDLIFSIADVALNPMVSGSGTNLKMFDYMAAGIPVITTEFGARGIEDRKSMIVADVKDMAQAIENIKGDKDLEGLTFNARKYIEENFDWQKIVREMVGYINKMI